MPIDENKLNEFLDKVVNDVGAPTSSALVVIGDKLGLYRAMAANGPMTPTELAKRTETAERYIREWLNAHAASGSVAYDAASGRYSLRPEQVAAFAGDSYLPPSPGSST